MCESRTALETSLNQVSLRSPDSAEQQSNAQQMVGHGQGQAAYTRMCYIIECPIMWPNSCSGPSGCDFAGYFWLPRLGTGSKAYGSDSSLSLPGGGG